MLMLAFLPLLAQMDPVQAIEEDVDYGDEIVVLEEEDPMEIYEIAFDDEDDLENFVFEEEENEGLP